jgi:hypothetical protein
MQQSETNEPHHTAERSLAPALKCFLREPLLHFLLLGIVLFAAYSAMERSRGGAAASKQIQLTLDDLRQTAAQIATGRQLGAHIAAQLVEQIRSMGLPAAQAVMGTTPRINDIVLRASLLSINEGSTAERVAIGFGSGASELRTAVEGYQMTARGLRKLGYGTLDASGSKAPGEAVGASSSARVKANGEDGSSKVEGRAKQTAQEIADVLKQRFAQQGWIN